MFFCLFLLVEETYIKLQFFHQFSGSPLPMITWFVDNEQIIEERNDGLGYGLKSDLHNHYLNDVRDTPSRLLVSVCMKFWEIYMITQS